MVSSSIIPSTNSWALLLLGAFGETASAVLNATSRDVYTADVDDAGPATNGKVKIFVYVVSMSVTREFVAANDGKTSESTVQLSACSVIMILAEDVSCISLETYVASSSTASRCSNDRNNFHENNDSLRFLT